jgi:hypothetical protein
VPVTFHQTATSALVLLSTTVSVDFKIASNDAVGGLTEELCQRCVKEYVASTCLSLCVLDHALMNPLEAMIPKQIIVDSKSVEANVCARCSPSCVR